MTKHGIWRIHTFGIFTQLCFQLYSPLSIIKLSKSAVIANGRAVACAANPISESAISSASNEILLHLDRFLSFNQRKSRFSRNGSADELEQFVDARFVKGNEDGNEDGDCTSGKLKRSCKGSRVVLKLPCATFNFYLITKTLQIQGSACGDIRTFLEDIVKSVPAAQTR